MAKSKNTTTPWGFTLEDAIEAFKFRQSVLGDKSAFNGYNPDRVSVYSMFPGMLCKAPNCTETYALRKDLPEFKGKDRHGIYGDYCRHHYTKLWNFRAAKKEKAVQRRKAYDEWCAAEKRREHDLMMRRFYLRYPEKRADELERNAQEKELSGLRAERKQDLKNRPKRRYSGPPRAGYVYRLYDAEEVLLYIGKSFNVQLRLYGKEGHANTKAWWGTVHGLRVTEYKTEADALEAEAFAIRSERPRFNRTMPIPKGAKRPRKVAEYTSLVEVLAI